MTEPVTFNTTLQAPVRSPEVRTIIEASRVAREVYDERDDDGYRRELHFFEQVYLTEMRVISDRYVETCGAAKRNPDLTPEAVDIVCRLALRTEAREMGNALRVYRDEREKFYNDQCEEVEFQMAAE